MKKIILSLVVLAVLVSCKTDPNKQVDEGNVHKNLYHSDDIGWTIEIPKGWDVEKGDVLDERNKKGMDAVNKTTGIEYDASGLKKLINFKKDKFHVFQSTSEPFKLEHEGEWEENHKLVKNLLYETYINKGMKIDTSSSKERIDNLDFEVFHITIYGNDGKILLNQDLYSKYINGYDFSVNINYIHDKERDEMETVWKNSKFE